MQTESQMNLEFIDTTSDHEKVGDAFGVLPERRSEISSNIQAVSNEWCNAIIKEAKDHKKTIANSAMLLNAQMNVLKSMQPLTPSEFSYGLFVAGHIYGRKVGAIEALTKVVGSPLGSPLLDMLTQKL